MKWYLIAIKRILKGIVTFLLPITLILFLLEKAFVLVRGLIQSIWASLPEKGLFGFGLLPLASAVVILLICYFAGRRAEQKKLRSFLPFVEDNLLVFIPGYTLLKSQAYEALGDTEEGWNSVLIGDDDGWKFGIEVEQHADGYSTVFFPEPPDAKAGEVRLFRSSALKRISIPASKLIAMTRRYGYGSASLGVEEKAEVRNKVNQKVNPQ
jgi:hypothetical protein